MDKWWQHVTNSPRTPKKSNLNCPSTVRSWCHHPSLFKNGFTHHSEWVKIWPKGWVNTPVGGSCQVEISDEKTTKKWVANSIFRWSQFQKMDVKPNGPGPSYTEVPIFWCLTYSAVDTPAPHWVSAPNGSPGRRNTINASQKGVLICHLFK